MSAAVHACTSSSPSHSVTATASTTFTATSSSSTTSRKRQSDEPPTNKQLKKKVKKNQNQEEEEKEKEDEDEEMHHNNDKPTPPPATTDTITSFPTTTTSSSSSSSSTSSSLSHSLLTYESFETLPLDLAKSIGDYLPLEEFRLLHCVSRTLMRIAGVGKPRRLRASDCTVAQMEQLLQAKKSQLRCHVGDLAIVKFVKPKKMKKMEEKREEEDGPSKQQRQQPPTSAANAGTETGATNSAVASSPTHRSSDPMIEEEDKENEEGDQDAVHIRQLYRLPDALPQLNAFECDLDLAMEDPDSLELISFPPLLTQLILRLRVIDPEDLLTCEQVYEVVQRLFDSIAHLNQLEFIDIDCSIFDEYPYDNEHRLTQLIQPLTRCASTLTSLRLTGNMSTEDDSNERPWTKEDIMIFRKFTKLEELDVTTYWTRQQLEWLLAPPSEGEEQSSFPKLTHFAMHSTVITDDIAPLLVRLPLLELFSPDSILTPDCSSWLNQMRHVEIIQLDCSDEVQVRTLVVALAELSQLKHVTLHHSALTSADLQRIFTGLKNCVEIWLNRLPAMSSLSWFTSVPHLVSSCRLISLCNCPALDFSELRRLNEMKQRNELPALSIIKLRGPIKDHQTNEQLKVMMQIQQQNNKTNWPELIALG